jgi:hypothetical protein
LTTHSFDSAIVRIEFAAKFLDVDVHGPQFDEIANGFLDKLRPGKAPAGLTHQHRQQSELTRADHDFARANLHGRPVRHEMIFGRIGRAGHVQTGFRM